MFSIILIVHIIFILISAVGSLTILGMLIGGITAGRRALDACGAFTVVGVVSGSVLLIFKPLPVQCIILLTYVAAAFALRRYVLYRSAHAGELAR